jgi:hypothetical protein
MESTLGVRGRTLAARGSAVGATLIAISCTDGFLKNTHSNFVFFILKDAALLLLIGAAFLWLNEHPVEQSWRRWQGLGVWAAFVGYMFAEIANPSGGITTGIAGFRAEVMFSVLFVIGAIFFVSPSRVARTVNVAIAWVVVAALAGMFQSFFPNVWDHMSPGLAFVSHKYTDWQSAGLGGLATAFARSYGTLVDPAAMGLACMVGFILSAGALARVRGGQRVLCFAAMLITGITLELSGSRLSAIGLGAGMLGMVVLSARYRSLRWSAISALVVCVLALAVGLKASGGGAGGRYSDASIQFAAMTRERSEAIVLADLPAHPFGLGLGATGAGGRQDRSQDTLAVDNVYFATVFQSGVPGVLLFVALQGTFLFLAIRNMVRTKNSSMRALYMTFASMQIALLVGGIWTQGAFTYAPVCQIFWLLSGALALPKRVEGIRE